MQQAGGRKRLSPIQGHGVLIPPSPLDEYGHGLHLTIRKHFECQLECRLNSLIKTGEFGGKINQTENF